MNLRKNTNKSAAAVILAALLCILIATCSGAGLGVRRRAKDKAAVVRAASLALADTPQAPARHAPTRRLQAASAAATETRRARARHAAAARHLQDLGVCSDGVSAGTCDGLCDAFNEDCNCWCDAACDAFGDCCSDVTIFCEFTPSPTFPPVEVGICTDGTPGTCNGLCDAFNEDCNCWCDAACEEFGDCCSDVANFCEFTPPPTPSPIDIGVCPDGTPGSCDGLCDGFNAECNCFCDDICSELGDCCLDVGTICPEV